MTKPTFSAKPYVRICVDDPDARQTRDLDGRVVCRLLQWAGKNGVFGIDGVSSAWRYVAYYTPKDAEKITNWLRENGAEEELE